MMRTTRILALVLTLFVLLPAATQAAGKKAVKTKIFRSRQAVERSLGKKVADQIPAGFNFKLHALVWVELPVADDAELKITQLPLHYDYGFSLKHSPALSLKIVRTTGRLDITLLSDNPCQLGVQRPQEWYEGCGKRLAADMEAAKQTLHLLATPRAYLKTVRVEKRQMPPRP